MLRAYSKSEGTGKGLGRDGPATGRVAAAYARHLLSTFDLPTDAVELPADPHPGLDWAASGSMALTGHADGPPALAPGHVAACARGAVAALATLAADPRAVTALDAPALLGERAAVLGLARRGTVSAGGRCRLLAARDGWLAVNLPRPEDAATIPAWLECELAADEPWRAVIDAARTRSLSSLVTRGRLLGLAVAPASPPAAGAPPWCRLVARGPRAAKPATSPLVVDLSALWAGPLASHLLQLAGARVVKVESTRRPDGGRRGPAAFFDLLHAGKASVALDFASAAGRAALRRLVARADVVVESARPRAAHQLGIDPAALVRARPGLTWVSITAYGRAGRAGRWIGFGDDTAAAAGFAAATGALAGVPTPLFCGDALADPLTGMHAAVAALAAYRRGGGVLLSLALRDVAAHVLGFGPAADPARVVRAAGTDGASAWEVVAAGTRTAVAAPRARAVVGRARPFGADTDAVLRRLDG